MSGNRDHAMLSWVLLDAFLAAILAIMAVLVDRHVTTPEEAFEGLARQPFREPLPPGIDLGHHDARRLPGTGPVLGRVSSFDLRNEPGLSGGVAIVGYEVYRSARVAESTYIEYFDDLRQANRVQGRGYRFFKVSGVTAPQHVRCGLSSSVVPNGSRQRAG